MKEQQSGFTLMEMVAVVAVIAILASIATPMVFKTIRSARVTAFASEVGVLRSAVSTYYTDTGQFPLHIPSDANDGRQLLLRNGTASPVSGWNGPYIEQQIDNPFNGASYRAILNTSDANYQFDLDGDGNVDTGGVSVLRVDSVSDEDARTISDIIDGDGDQAQGVTAWNAAGRVKRYGINSDHSHIMLIYISEL